jgi:hypothetical protein
MQATGYYGYWLGPIMVYFLLLLLLRVRAYYDLFLVTMVTYWLGPVIVHFLLLWLLSR